MANLFYLGTSIVTTESPITGISKLYKRNVDAIEINISDEDKADLLISGSIDAVKKEKIIKEILGEKLISHHKNKKPIPKSEHLTKSKVGFLKEGYNNIYGINPIDRYNFVIDRYNEDSNRDNDIYLRRIPTIKIIRRLYDLYTWINRIIFAVFLVIAYYCYNFKYKKSFNRDLSNLKNSSSVSTRSSRTKVITYRYYLFDENRDFFNRNSDNPSCYLIIFGLLFLFLSFYIVLIFFFVMLIPNVIFTVYLSISLFIHRMNKHLQPNIFKNIINEPKLDEKAQLNDYVTVDSQSLKYYDGFSFFDKLSKLYFAKNILTPQSFMLYGDLFANEYEILVSSFYKQITGIFCFALIGYMFYL